MRILRVTSLILAAAFFFSAVPDSSSQAALSGLDRADPESVGLLGSRLKNIDAAVAESIRSGETPGAVVLVARRGKIAYLKAFGNRSVEPSTEPMTVDTIFDISSLTKVVATVPSVMLLVEDGKLRLADRVKRYLPKFTGDGKDPIVVRQLLNHYSGLAADFDLSKSWSGRAAALEELWDADADSDPKFVYSDINFIALGEIVHALSGKPLDEFARERIFQPLGMKETFFRPPSDMVGRIAPTEPRKNTLRYLKGVPSAGLDKMVRGEVHDPTAWRMGGVAGHAGLFSTAQDLAIYAQTLLGKGTYRGFRLLSPLTVAAMTSPQSPPGAKDIRGYGWDLDSVYSAPRGDLLGAGYGHSGFTGTSLWIYPPADTFVIVLSNRVHPKGGKDINHLRAVIANIVASAIVE